MKKIIIILFFIVFVIGTNKINPYLAFANGNGACSYHGGVNCAAGPDRDGSVICNDGWRDSSVSYYQVEACKTNSKIDYSCLNGRKDTRILFEEPTGYTGLIEKINNADPNASLSMILNNARIQSQLEYNERMLRYESSCIQDEPFVQLQETSPSFLDTPQDDISNYDDVFEEEINEQQKEEPLPVSYNELIFSDVDSSSFYFEEIKALKEMFVIEGYLDGSFRPNNKLNRAELLKIVIESRFGLIENQPTNGCFHDVPYNEWYAKYICFAKKKNIIEGYFDGSFKPDKEITIAEAMKITLATYGVTLEGDPWYSPYMNYFNNNIQELSIKWFCRQGCLPEQENISRGKMAYLIISVMTYMQKTL